MFNCQCWWSVMQNYTEQSLGCWLWRSFDKKATTGIMKYSGTICTTFFLPLFCNKCFEKSKLHWSIQSWRVDVGETFRMVVRLKHVDGFGEGDTGQWTVPRTPPHPHHSSHVRSLLYSLPPSAWCHLPLHAASTIFTTWSVPTPQDIGWALSHIWSISKFSYYSHCHSDSNHNSYKIRKHGGKHRI